MSVESSNEAGADPLLVFRVGATWLAVDALAVTEIIDRAEPIPLPRAPNHVSGVVHLRGRAVPVLDLRQYLEIPASDKKAAGAVFPRIVIVEAHDMRVGMPCDEVMGVLPATESQLTQTQLTGGRLSKFARGELESPKGTTVAIDVERLLDAARVEE